MRLFEGRAWLKFVLLVTDAGNDTCRTVCKGGVVNRYEIACLYLVTPLANRCSSLNIFIASLPNELLSYTYFPADCIQNCAYVYVAV